MESLVGVPPRLERVAELAGVRRALDARELPSPSSRPSSSPTAQPTERIRLEFVAETPEIAVLAIPSRSSAFRTSSTTLSRRRPAARCACVSERRLAARVRRDQRHGRRHVARGAEARVHAGVAQPLGRGGRNPGRGIGLGVTKELLDQNGGKISLLSEPGHGWAEVTIMFPLFREGRG